MRVLGPKNINTIMKVNKIESRSQSQYRDWNRKSLGLGLDIETEESKVSVSVSTTRLTICLYWSRSRDSKLSIANPCIGNEKFPLKSLFRANYQLFWLWKWPYFTHFYGPHAKWYLYFKFSWKYTFSYGFILCNTFKFSPLARI